VRGRPSLKERTREREKGEGSYAMTGRKRRCIFDHSLSFENEIEEREKGVQKVSFIIVNVVCLCFTFFVCVCVC